jgi:hypothetical protein
MELKSKPLSEIENEAVEDLEIMADRLEYEAARTPTLFNKYYKQYRLVRTEIAFVEAQIKHKRRSKWYYYSGKAKPEVYKAKPLDVKLLKSDVKKHIDSDSEIIELETHLDLLKIKRDTIKAILDEIGSRSYHINNMLKSMYFKNGIV